MKETVVKKVCRCEKCGNEAEMMITCSLPSPAENNAQDGGPKTTSAQQRVKGHATCSHCGNEADMWIDL